MTDVQTDFDFLPLQVTGKSADGKNRYDREGKRKLIEACQKPGASVAGLALKAGVNASQLRKWIGLERKQTRPRRARQSAPASTPAFVPVLEVVDGGPAYLPPRPSLADTQPTTARRETTMRPSQRPPLPSRLVAQLPNGVSLELECAQQDTALLKAMIDALRGR
ncbi:IS66-like element accessory protein TnpA [Paraburkholderia strydomiana]|uniref:IS66-like element accessory protein TnpA n=1 Tax=Paraburkholderia strydomiana TaxID=1245417 RepID=UPI0038BBDB4C